MKLTNICARILCGVAVLTGFSYAALAGECKANCGVISVGQPKLWPLADAQYMVGDARDKLKALRIALPNEDAGRGILDPNSIDLRQVDILLQSLGVAVQYNQQDALTNRINQQKYQRDLADYQNNQAQKNALDAQINQKNLEKAGLDTEIQEKTQQQLALKAQSDDLDTQINKAKADLDKLNSGALPDPTDVARQKDLIRRLQDNQTELQKRNFQLGLNLAELTPRRDRLVTEIATLSSQKQALGNVQAPTLNVTATAPPAASDRAPEANLLSSIFSDSDVKAALVDSLKKAIARDPKAPYVIQLTNVIDGYLQTIARRLTMLRQSGDPNYDLYLMELSTSLEPAAEAKNHLARARWILGKAELDRIALAEELVTENLFNRMVKQAEHERWFMRANRRYVAAGSLTASADEKLNEALRKYLAAGCGSGGVTGICNGHAGAEPEYRAVITRGILQDHQVSDVSGMNVEELARKLEPLFDQLVAQSVSGAWAVSSVNLGTTATPGQTDNTHSEDVGRLITQYMVAGCGHPSLSSNGVCQGQSGTTSDYNDIIARGIMTSNDAKVRHLEGLKPYVFELSPAQAAVNIARSEVRESKFSIIGVLKLLSGIGASVSYQRQHDIYRQFLEQDVFQAGIGKGSGSEFGWDFSPMPGAERVAGGGYSTYGVLAMPSFRRSIQFDTKADWILRPSNHGKSHAVCDASKKDRERCEETNATSFSATIHTVQLPSRYDFWVDSLYYPRVPVGEEVSVILRGKGFTGETMVLINNIPLTPRWRLIDPASSDVSYAAPNGATPNTVENGGGDRKAYGAYEIMSSDTIVMRFRVPGFEGVPQITLISPHRTVHINDFDMPINIASHSNPISLNVIQKRYESGASVENIMFGPADDWRTLASQEFLRIENFDPHVDVRLRLKHVPLTDSVVKVLDGKEWKIVTDASPNHDLSSVILPNVPVYDGDLNLKVVKIVKVDNKDKEADVYLQARIPVPLRPRIEKLSETSGAADGGNTITIEGSNFSHAGKVFFGANEAPILSRNSGALQVRVPKGDADTKAKVRVVSELTLDGKELASTEDSKVYAYDAAPTPKPKSAFKDIHFGDLGIESAKVNASVDINVPDDSGTPSISAYDGTKFVKLTATRTNNTMSVSQIAVIRGKIRLLLSVQKGKTTTNLEDKTFDVPFVPQVDTPLAPVKPGETLVITGHNLQLVDSVAIGSAAVKLKSTDDGGHAGAAILTRAYDQLTLTVPARDVIQPDSTGNAKVVVTAGSKSSRENALLPIK